MKLPVLLSFIFLLGFSKPTKREYQRTYHNNGHIASEGWILSNKRDGYWKIYHENGNLSQQGNYKYNKREGYWYFYSENALPLKEGHYADNLKTNWWLFYDSQGRINHKCQLNQDLKNGYCLRYTNERLVLAEKYNKGKKIKEWTSFSAFQKENSLSDLK